MPKHIKKADLPTKICPACGRPFAWRKKWEKVWEQVKYCSDRCRNQKQMPERHIGPLRHLGRGNSL
jgi:hypothetical protein